MRFIHYKKRAQKPVWPVVFRKGTRSALTSG